MARSGAAVERALCHNSACERVLVNTIAVRASRNSARTVGRRRSPRCPAHGNGASASGSKLSISIRFGIPPSTTSIDAGVPSSVRPPSTSAASSIFPSVAERPHTRRPGAARRRRASASAVRTPRFEPRSSCHSSTITVCSPAKRGAKSGWLRRSERLSGVVTSASPGLLRIFRLRYVDTSPVQRSTRQSIPRPCSGSRRFVSVSAASARMGVIHKTRRPRSVPLLAVPKAPNHTARVFPLPVAEWSRPEAPVRIRAHTRR